MIYFPFLGTPVEFFFVCLFCHFNLMNAVPNSESSWDLGWMGLGGAVGGVVAYAEAGVWTGSAQHHFRRLFLCSSGELRALRGHHLHPRAETSVSGHGRQRVQHLLVSTTV